MRRIVDNPAAVFNRAARAILASVEGDNAMTEGRSPKKYAASSSAVARIVGAPAGQWHDWCGGSKSPTYRAIVSWGVKWEGAGYPPIVVIITSAGSAAA